VGLGYEQLEETGIDNIKRDKKILDSKILKERTSPQMTTPNDYLISQSKRSGDLKEEYLTSNDYKYALEVFDPSYEDTTTMFHFLHQIQRKLYNEALRRVNNNALAQADQRKWVQNHPINTLVLFRTTEICFTGKTDAEFTEQLFKAKNDCKTMMEVLKQVEKSSNV